MLVENGRHLVGRDTTKSAIRGDAEIGKVLARSRETRRKSLHVMDDAEIDPRSTWFQILQRFEERIGDIGQNRDVYPVHPAAGGLERSVGEIDRGGKIARGEARPAAKRAEAEMVAELDALR